MHYLVETEKNDFWDKDSGFLDPQIAKSLKNRFTKTAKLKEGLYAQKYSLTHQIIDYPNANIMKCPVCKRPLTDTSKHKPIYYLDTAEEFEGIKMCSSCAWEMDYDVKHEKSTESVLEQFRD